MKKLRVAFVDYVVEPSQPGRSGLSDVVWDMASELVNQGHEPHVIGSYHTKHMPDPRVIVHNFPTPPIGYRNLIGQSWIIKRATIIVNRIKPDIVHTPEYFSTALMDVLGIRIPMVLNVPGNIYQRLSVADGSGFEWYFAQVLKWAAKRSARKCARIVAISEEMRYWWERTGSPSHRTVMIPLGVDLRRFAPVADARERLGISPDRVLFLYVGRFSREKGLRRLFEAMASLKPLPPNFEMRLIGKGPQETELRNVAANLGLSAVKWHCWMDPRELPTWYSAADAMLLPSITEPLARTLLEAMACGTPVIASNTGGSIEHIHDGITGYLFDQTDATALTTVLQNAVRHPEVLRSMRPAVRAYANEYLSWPKVVHRMITEVYLPIVV